MVGVNGRDGSHAFRGRKLACALEGFPTRRLHAYLYNAIRTLEGPPHAPRVVGIKSHGLFLIDILACLEGGNKVERVLVLRSGNQHGVNGFVVEHAPKIPVGLNCGSDFFGFFLPTGVNISDRDSLRIWRFERVLENVHPAPACADQSEPHAVVGAENTRRKNRRTGQRGRASRDVTNETSSIEHDCNSFD
jgi:hypothetical protein